MISILFCAKNSVYKTLTDSAGEPLDVWDEDRDAMLWPGGNPVVAHPPCGQWGSLRNLPKFKRRSDEVLALEKAMGPWAVDQVQKWSGVLEHPAKSSLWDYCELPNPGRFDRLGGFTISIPQFWFGHKAYKLTWLYIVGSTPLDIPEIPLKLGEATHIVSGLGARKDSRRPALWSDERKATPVAFARWLVETAERCQKVAK